MLPGDVLASFLMSETMVMGPRSGAIRALERRGSTIRLSPDAVCVLSGSAEPLQLSYGLAWVCIDSSAPSTRLRLATCWLTVMPGSSAAIRATRSGISLVAVFRGWAMADGPQRQAIISAGEIARCSSAGPHPLPQFGPAVLIAPDWLADNMSFDGILEAPVPLPVEAAVVEAAVVEAAVVEAAVVEAAVVEAPRAVIAISSRTVPVGPPASLGTTYPSSASPEASVPPAGLAGRAAPRPRGRRIWAGAPWLATASVFAAALATAAVSTVVSPPAGKAQLEVPVASLTTPQRAVTGHDAAATPANVAPAVVAPPAPAVAAPPATTAASAPAVSTPVTAPPVTVPPVTVPTPAASLPSPEVTLSSCSHPVGALTMSGLVTNPGSGAITVVVTGGFVSSSGAALGSGRTTVQVGPQARSEWSVSVPYALGASGRCFLSGYTTSP
jgi:hypothetical protein